MTVNSNNKYNSSTIIIMRQQPSFSIGTWYFNGFDQKASIFGKFFALI
jgi:hypothetical protein